MTVRAQAAVRPGQLQTRSTLMFVTKKSLPRRTFLRGLGVAMGLPLLDAHGAGAHRGGADGGQPRVPVRGHLRAARHDHGSVDAGDRRRRSS